MLDYVHPLMRGGVRERSVSGGSLQELGLNESYQVSSSDLTAFEQRLLLLEQLSQMAGYFLILVIGIGAFLLVILTMLNVRERKYEIGVLTAIGMKKSKVAIQFFIENAMVPFIALCLGAGLGAGCSVSLTNTLLASQIESQAQQSLQQQQSFDRSDRWNDLLS